MEPYDLGNLPLVKVATNRIANLLLERRDIVRLSDDGYTKRACDIAALRCFLDQKDDLRHDTFPLLAQDCLTLLSLLSSFPSTVCHVNLQPPRGSLDFRALNHNLFVHT
jgi:hypothetical protein